MSGNKPLDERAASTANPAAEFVRVARSGQVPDGYVRRFFAGDVEMCVARFRGKAYATSNYCTHLDCLLSSGKLVDDGIGCSCHGSVFDLDSGEAIYPPATEPIRTYPVREEDGEIYVAVTPEEAATAGPRRRNLRKELTGD
jgi:3-phenylpropionate/trans-cinnamate dioxygenase ferredoxin component